MNSFLVVIGLVIGHLGMQFGVQHGWPFTPSESQGCNELFPDSGDPVRVGVVGLVHTHVHWILGREDSGDIEIVGIVEPNRELAERYSRQHGYSMDIVYNTLEEMVEAASPEAVTAFNTIYGHLEVVEYCAPRGIHVMVEKPLAANLEHAKRMEALAREHGIHLLTNYETSWYGSNRKAFDMVKEGALGPVRRIVFNTGHPGPVEIGCNEEFLEWLTDPVLNGGGALNDFGCYGANLATWLLQGNKPLTVSCVVQHLKPERYPRVEDEATIVLTYPSSQVIIQASWNWPYNRKDMTVYGTSGYVLCRNATDMEIMMSETSGTYQHAADALARGYHDPFAILFKVIREDYELPAFSPSSLENNMMVMQILDLARKAAETGTTIDFP